MIEKLALKHSTWVSMARGICKDAYLADDLVSDMYIKLSAYDKEVNDYYVFYTIKHLYINWLRQENKFTGIENAAFITVDDEVKKYIPDYIPDCLTWVEKQILLLRQDKSGRDIEKQYHINFQKIHRIEKKAKEKLTEWAKSYEGQGI